MSANSLSVMNAAAGRKAVPTLTEIVQSTLLFTLVLFPVSFMLLLLHEGGHALANLALGSKVEIFYAHPFALDGYVRPFAAVENAARKCGCSIQGWAGSSTGYFSGRRGNRQATRTRDLARPHEEGCHRASQYAHEPAA